MAIQTRTTLNQLLSAWPKGTVAVPSWLAAQGVSRQLGRSYQRTTWLARLGRGAFVRVDDNVIWAGGLYAMQQQMGLAIHAGGKTALELQGYAHFLPLGSPATVNLFGAPGQKLPAWFKDHDWQARIRYTATNLFKGEAQLGLTEKAFGEFNIKLSTPERALMEVLHFVPLQETFEESRLLMEGMTTLRASLVQSLLERCNSVKVKRLFLFLAETCKHAWVSKLDLSGVDLGKGKRVIVKGGRLDPKYSITVTAGNLPSQEPEPTP